MSDIKTKHKLRMEALKICTVCLTSLGKLNLAMVVQVESNFPAARASPKKARFLSGQI
jgi:hypothetical protein